MPCSTLNFIMVELVYSNDSVSIWQPKQGPLHRKVVSSVKLLEVLLQQQLDLIIEHQHQGTCGGSRPHASMRLSVAEEPMSVVH